MSIRTPMCLPPAALRRNRLTLAMLLVAAVPLGAAGMGYVLGSQRGGPLLMSIVQQSKDAGLSADGEIPGGAVEASAENDADDAPASNLSTSSLQVPSNADSLNEVRMFNGRPLRPARTIRMKVTAYSPDERSCGNFADGITASGYSVSTNGGKLVAADTRLLPFGSLISVPGYDGGAVVPVLDRGGAIKGNRLDVLYSTHERALKWGVQHLDVTVWEYADGKPHGFKAIYNSKSAIKD